MLDTKKGASAQATLGNGRSVKRRRITNRIVPPPLNIFSDFMRNLVSPLLYSNASGSILDEHWDNLIILDACRLDSFSEAVSEVLGMKSVPSRISEGSDTYSFLVNNFGWTRHDDIVYVTANPVVSSATPRNFFKMIDVWKYAWNERVGTVSPSDVCNYALEAKELHPDKRLIIHFLQPHAPYLSSETIARRMRQSETNRPGARILGMDITFFPLSVSFQVDCLPIDSRYQAYKEDLREVIKCVAGILPALNGKTVVTADHGEAFGERLHRFVPLRIYGHLPVRMPVLVRVPWLTIQGEKSSQASRGSVSTSKLSRADEDIINQRLKSLGYI